jgi:hypothetical protein
LGTQIVFKENLNNLNIDLEEQMHLIERVGPWPWKAFNEG